MFDVQIQVFGGVNFADEPSSLLRNSHFLEQSVWQHKTGVTGRVIGIDAADGKNFDLLRDNLITRKGSASYADLTSILDGNSSTVDSDSASGQKVLNVAATTGFKVDGSIIINSGGAREETGVVASIQAGVSLTLAANLTNTHTAVQADAVAQRVFLNADVAVLGPVEMLLPETDSFVRYVVSKKTIYSDESGSWRQMNDSAGAAYVHAAQSVTKSSMTLADGGVFFGLDGANKIQRHMGGADLEVQIDNGNAYVDAGGTAQTITGTWGTAYSNLETLHGRLLFNKGNSTVEYTDVNQPWDLAGGGNFPCSGKVLAIKTHVPQFGDSLAAIIYIGTGVGWEFTTDLVSANTIQGSPPPMNQNLVVSTKNWIIYLSADGGLYGITGNKVINLGRRFKAQDASSGPLDTIHLGNTLSIGNAAYNIKKEQAIFLISDSASGDPNLTLVLDFHQGEPFLNEPLLSFESHVRCLSWSGQDYVGMGITRDGFIGIRSGGTMWTMETGAVDYGATAIDTDWFSPMMDGGAPINPKNVLTWFGRALRSGNWSPQIDFLLDRNTVSSKSISFDMGTAASVYGTAVYGTGTYSGDGLVKHAEDIDLIAEVFQIKISHGTAGENFNITNFNQRYNILAEER